MPHSVADIVRIGFPTIAQTMGHPNYVLGEILDGQDGTFKAAIYYTDAVGTHAALFSWARHEEHRLLTERDKITFAARMMENAINSLHDAIRNRMPGVIVEPMRAAQEVAIDVDFGE